MKKCIHKNTSLLVAILTILISINFAQAQQRGQQGRQQGSPSVPNDQQIEKMVTDLSKELSLSEEQEKQVSDLYFAHFEEVAEIRKKNKNSKPDREAMKQMREEFETEVKTHLTKEQQKQFDVFMKEKTSKRSG